MSSSRPRSGVEARIYQPSNENEMLELDELIASDQEEQYIERRMSYGWRPKYLRRRVVIMFNIIFIALIVILEVLSGLSIQNDGFIFAGVDVFNMCRLIIPAALTLILSFWIRFEYQACRFLPWMILAYKPEGLKSIYTKRNDATRTIALDYTSVWTPNAMITAAKNKHFLVLSALIVSMLLRIQILLSASLFYVHLVNKPESVEVGLQDKFVDQVDTPLPSMGYTPYVLEQGNWTTPVDYPRYSIPGVALQHFDDTVLAGVENGTSLTFTADGVAVMLSCEHPPVSITRVGNKTTNFTISPLHDIPSRTFEISNFYLEQLPSDGPYVYYYWEDTSYDNSSSDPFFMSIIISNDSDVDFRTTAFSCTLSVQVRLYDVTVEDAKLSVAQHSEPSFVRSIRAGLLVYMWRSYPNPMAEYALEDWIRNGSCGSLVPGNIMESYARISLFESDLIPFQVGSKLLRNGSFNAPELMNPSTLEDVMRLYHSIYGSLVAHYELREPFKNSTRGSVARDISRLGVQPYISQIMVGLFALAIVLTFPLLWQVSPKDGFVPFKPDNIAGMAILLCRSYELIAALNNSGHQPIKALQERTRGVYYTTLIHHSSTPLYPSFCVQNLLPEGRTHMELPSREPRDIEWYQPWTLNPVARAMSLFITIGFLAALIALVRYSLRSEGLGSAPGDSSSHYLWTSLPSLLFISLSTYLGSCDFELRSLAPFVLLSSGPAIYREMLTTSFVDQTTVRTLVRSLKKGHIVIILSTSITLICSLLSIFTATLFTVEMRSMNTTISLQQAEWLTSKTFSIRNSIKADMILNANLSYPQWTFEDLVIPKYQLGNLTTANDTQQDSTITSQLRATRAVLNCNHSTSTGDISFDIYGNKTTCNLTKPLKYPVNTTEPFGLDPLGVRWLCNVDDSAERWPPYMYLWGKGQANQEGLATWGNDSFATVLMCDESFEEVEVDATLFGPNLEMRESHPPVPVRLPGNPIALIFIEPVVDYSPGYDIADPYLNLVDGRGQYNSIFGTLTTDRYAIPNEWLGDTSKNEEVIAAIKKLHGIFRAQMIRDTPEAWQFLNDTSTSASIVTQDKLPIPPVDAQIWQTVPRIIQDETSTYVLVGLLAAIFTLNAMLVWLSERHGYRRAVPKPPGTIVAVASLFANSRIFSLLPPNAQWSTHEKLEKHFEGKLFQMGWFSSDTPEEGQVFTIGVLDG
ncbi:hypothetical protein F5Y00DRAFT_268144 [Daldinia vernicosa]|uniref:uncharacterized protein n=1 Tax=Daldinia vernicosa TaxID=114800 RepID=UPI0020084324|nr:uncharacterized protein F5Y00DRAFT_268144 [Daldinia vernicosa]KAI0850710.1 hypothetical protein F5Y00DRAFT_268144 [Daldinia vernicosa]